MIKVATRPFTAHLLATLALLYSSAAFGAGTIPVALAQQSDANGRPLAGALLYIYQVGTVATPQNSFQDFGLSLTNPWPLQADSTGRIPMFYLADGAVHVRLTDATGVVVFDYPTMQVVGPSAGGGGGGGGGTVDPSAIAATGDIKFRVTTDVPTGWVRLNGRTVGNAGSGGTERANADTQNLFTYLWLNCPDTHCPVPGGRGGTPAGDFGASKTITLPDWRGRTAVGLDDMGSTPAGRILNSNVTSGGGDGVTTPQATGGEANHTLTVGELAAHNHTATEAAHTHTFTYNRFGDVTTGSTGLRVTTIDQTGDNQTATTQAATPTITVTNTGSGAPHNVMMPFLLGTWLMKL